MDRGSLSSHEYTTHRDHKNQQPQYEACTGTGQTTQAGAWGFPWLTPLLPTSQTLGEAMENPSPWHKQPGWTGTKTSLGEKGWLEGVRTG